jgi:hypothetical protein
MTIDTNLLFDYPAPKLREVKRLIKDELNRRHWEVATKRHVTQPKEYFFAQSMRKIGAK